MKMLIAIRAGGRGSQNGGPKETKCHTVYSTLYSPRFSKDRFSYRLQDDFRCLPGVCTAWLLVCALLLENIEGKTQPSPILVIFIFPETKRSLAGTVCSVSKISS